MIGGATTSQLHVALKIAPVYSGPVVWMKDASQNPIVAARLMSDKQLVGNELSNIYEEMRQHYNDEQKDLLSIDEARKNKLKLWEQ
jgi:5-methyltetrahydrofolate--homocysteine methyltransferase